MAALHVKASQRLVAVAEAKILHADGTVEHHYSLPHLPWYRLRGRRRVRAWLRGMRPEGPITIHQADKHGHVVAKGA